MQALGRQAQRLGHAALHVARADTVNLPARDPVVRTQPQPASKMFGRGKPGAASNPARASRLQSSRPVRRVAELGSLGGSHTSCSNGMRQTLQSSLEWLLPSTRTLSRIRSRSVATACDCSSPSLTLRRQFTSASFATAWPSRCSLCGASFALMHTSLRPQAFAAVSRLAHRSIQSPTWAFHRSWRVAFGFSSSRSSRSSCLSHDMTPPPKKQGLVRKPVFIGDFAVAVLPVRRSRQHKKAGHGCDKKSHAARAADQVVEPEAGRMIQSQMINLLIGVVSRPTRITHAASDRVGSCGAKLLNGLLKHQWQAGLQLPFRFAPNSPQRARHGKRQFLP